jgi:hypothetical protein
VETRYIKGRTTRANDEIDLMNTIHDQYWGKKVPFSTIYGIYGGTIQLHRALLSVLSLANLAFAMRLGSRKLGSIATIHTPDLATLRLLYSSKLCS